MAPLAARLRVPHAHNRCIVVRQAAFRRTTSSVSQVWNQHNGDAVVVFCWPGASVMPLFGTPDRGRHRSPSSGDAPSIRSGNYAQVCNDQPSKSQHRRRMRPSAPPRPTHSCDLHIGVVLCPTRPVQEERSVVLSVGPHLLRIVRRLPTGATAAHCPAVEGRHQTILNSKRRPGSGQAR
jgi:hypothetical protein